MIRVANHSDIEQIWQIKQKASQLLNQRGVDQWQRDELPKTTLLNEINKNTFYVYEENHQILGMAFIKEGIEETYNNIDGQWHFEEPYITIHRLAVDASLLNKGIASQLIEFCKAYAKSKHIKIIRIDTHKDNLPAQKLFTKHGFVYCGTIMLDQSMKGDRLRLAYDYQLEV